MTLSLLMLAGDVESNPGPGSSDAKLDKLQIAIESLTRNVNLHQAENYTKLNQINEGIASLGERVTNLEAKVNEISGLKEGLASVRETLGAVECDLTSFKDRLACLDEGLDEVSNRMRRNNLIFRGLAEKENETWSETEAVLTTFVKDKLGVEAGEIERAHRLGTRRGRSARPIIVKFLNFKCKDEILRNAYKLKDVAFPKVSISEDFSPKVRLARSKLWGFASQYRTQNVRYKLSFDKLHVNNEVYVYDHVHQTVRLLNRPQGATNAHHD